MINILIQNLWITATILIFISGIYFSFKLKFIHLNFIKMFKALNEKSTSKNAISSFEALSMSLAGRIGVGSLSGIALAVYLGGPGILFWIWITSLLCAPNTFAESVLAVIFRKQDSKGIYQGGPYYYINDGLKNKRLAIIYASIVLISFICGFLTIQVNTVTKSINSIYNIPPIIIGIIISFLAALTIFKGVKNIANVTSKLVPIVTIFYLLICLFIIIVNITELPKVIIYIFNSAFNYKTFGIGILSTMLIGMQKGIFSSEVGLGTGSIAAVTADTSNATNTGLVQTLGIHIENLLIATITVFVICLSDYNILNINDPNGIEITLNAFNYHLGTIGVLFVVISITLFGLSTVFTGYYYGESSLRFIKKTNKLDIFILKILTLIILTLSSVLSSSVLWILVDIMVGFLAIINIYVLISLRKLVTDEFSNSVKNKRN